MKAYRQGKQPIQQRPDPVGYTGTWKNLANATGKAFKTLHDRYQRNYYPEVELVKLTIIVKEKMHSENRRKTPNGERTD